MKPSSISHRGHLLPLLVVSVFALPGTGCCEELIPACGEACAEYAWTPETAGAVTGTVRRKSSLDLDDDARGTLCIGLYNTCNAEEARRVVGFFISNADLSDPDTVVPFEISPVPPGTYHLRAKLDDDGTGCPGTGSQGDIVTRDCETFTVEADGVVDVEPVLDFVIPL